MSGKFEETLNDYNVECPYCHSAYQAEGESYSEYERDTELAALRQQLEEAQEPLEHLFPYGMPVGTARKFLTVFNRHGNASWGWEAEYGQKSQYGFVSRADAAMAAVKYAAEQRLAGTGQEAVAWGIPNSRPTERNPLMQVLLDNTSCQYPELLIPLYLHPAPPATDERVRLDALRWNILVEAIESGGMTIAMENGTQGTIRLGKGNLQHGIDAALAASKADGKGGA